MSNPKCCYCDWSLGEWSDGKTKSRERIECPNCLKTYFCKTFNYLGGWRHIVTRLGRKQKTNPINTTPES